MGLYSHRACCDSPDLSQIFLLILDTRGFPKGKFIKDMEIMEVFGHIESPPSPFAATMLEQDRGGLDSAGQYGKQEVFVI